MSNHPKPWYWPPEGTQIPSITVGECILCGVTVYSTGKHECPIEVRIREIVREELDTKGNP